MHAPAPTTTPIGACEPSMKPTTHSSASFSLDFWSTLTSTMTPTRWVTHQYACLGRPVCVCLLSLSRTVLLAYITHHDIKHCFVCDCAAD